jgi:hypothetical protein
MHNAGQPLSDYALAHVQTLQHEKIKKFKSLELPRLPHAYVRCRRLNQSLDGGTGRIILAFKGRKTVGVE